MRSPWLYINLLVLISVTLLHADTTDELLLQHGAEYELKSYYCTVSGNKANLVTKKRIKIYNKRGEEYSYIRLSELPLMELKNVNVTIKDSSGSIVFERKKKDLKKACGYDNIAIYSENCIYYTDATYSVFPYTVEIEYEYDIKSLFFWRGTDFQEDIPVQRAQYTLEINKSSKFRYKTTGQQIEPEITNLGKTSIYLWSIDNLEPLDVTSRVPAGFNNPIGLKLCSNKFGLEGYSFLGTQWVQVGQWYNEMCKDRMLTIDQARPLTDTAKAMRITESLYNEVRENIRYVAISIGIGGWQPHKAEQTLKWGYGDCKDMSNLLVSKLLQNGITAYPVLVRTKGAGLIDTTFPSFSFNHAIAVALIGKDTVWMDPTSEFSPFGQLPLADQDIPVLAVTDLGGEIWYTTASTWQQNSISRTTTWDIDSTLYATITSELSTTGLLAQSIRSSISGMSNDELRQYVNSWFKGATKQFGITDYDLQNSGDLNEPMIIRITGKTSKAARKIGKTFYFNPFVLNSLNAVERTNLTGREFPLNLYYPDFETDQITVRWDKSILIDSIAIPEGDSLGYSFGHCNMSGKLFIDSATFLFQKASYQYSLELDQFDDFKEYRSKVKKLTKKHIKLIIN